MNEEQLSLELEQVQAENRYLRHQLDNTFHEALRLRQAMERIYSAAHMTLHVINQGEPNDVH